ncbi:MAG: lysine--tRNA ligase, partial [Caldilineaceae bacterium]|nr:lysine--tRNA ligase [Caldilineaceae bacterium]
MTSKTHPMFEPENLSDQENARLDNLRGLQEAGIEPFPARAKQSHTIAQARALYRPDTDDESEAQDVVSVAGRIKSIRTMGKMSFADLEDGSGRIQLVVRRDTLPENWYNTIWKKLIDLGDFVSATGPLVMTRAGELSVDCREIQFLSKALKPMPDKWHGVRDPEVRYRRRHLDLIANPEVREIFRKRAAIVRA